MTTQGSQPATQSLDVAQKSIFRSPLFIAKMKFINSLKKKVESWQAEFYVSISSLAFETYMNSEWKSSTNWSEKSCERSRWKNRFLTKSTIQLKSIIIYFFTLARRYGHVYDRFKSQTLFVKIQSNWIIRGAQKHIECRLEKHRISSQLFFFNLTYIKQIIQSGSVWFKTS